MEKLEIVEFMKKLLEESKNWDNNIIINNTIMIGEKVKEQLSVYMKDDKYRVDRNEILAYFESVKKFNDLNLPFSQEHYTQLIERVIKKIRPYPHYSGLSLSFPEI